MSDRLQDLLRQKALLEEHAAWLERQISLECTAAGTGEPAPAVPPAPIPPAPALAPDPASVDEQAEAILGRYRQPTGSVQQATRRGCLLYFAAAFVLLGLAVAALSLHYRHR
jgi:hypothetical protein